jgi:hypothetical protein
MAALIGNIDRSISCSGSMSPGVRESLHQEALPLPRIVLDATVSEPSSQADQVEMDRVPTNVTSKASHAGSLKQRQNPDAQRHHASDSGIGSTVSGTIRTTSENGDSSETCMYSLALHPSYPLTSNLSVEQSLWNPSCWGWGVSWFECGTYP